MFMPSCMPNRIMTPALCLPHYDTMRRHQACQITTGWNTRCSLQLVHSLIWAVKPHVQLILQPNYLNRVADYARLVESQIILRFWRDLWAFKLIYTLTTMRNSSLSLLSPRRTEWQVTLTVTSEQVTDQVVLGCHLEYLYDTEGAGFPPLWMGCGGEGGLG